MARKRMIDPEFFLDEQLAAVSAHARLLYIGLWQICDDNYATLPDRPAWIKAQVLPYETIKVERLLTELESAGCIVRFRANDADYWFIRSFFKYQKVDHPSAAKYPEFKEDMKVSERSREVSRVVGKNIVKSQFSCITDITEDVMQEIATKYRVPLAFVKSKVDDMQIWHDQNPRRNNKSNWKATLMNWVKKDALKIAAGQPINRLGVTKV